MAHTRKRRDDDGDDVIRQRPIVYASARAYKAWRCALAADVFAGLEFLLFLATIDIFTYYYHLYLSGTPYSASALGSNTFDDNHSNANDHHHHHHFDGTKSTLEPGTAAHTATPLAQIPEMPPPSPLGSQQGLGMGMSTGMGSSTTTTAAVGDGSGMHADHGQGQNHGPMLGITHFENHGPGTAAPVPDTVFAETTDARPQTGYEDVG
ncbi:hypothetical protein LTS18_008118, partial [Coniosporium uncinatum]